MDMLRAKKALGIIWLNKRGAGVRLRRMKQIIRLRAGAVLGTAVALALGSCAYDPYYMGGGAYSTGYGDGYANSGFSTSLFVSTGNSRWGYDPACYSYYDYTRRCYYDPYLYGYYPVGYRPPLVFGVPHPRGYSRSYCPPPSRVTNRTLANYGSREQSYRNSSYPWANQVHQRGGTANNPSRLQPQAPYSRSGNPGYSGTRSQAPVPSVRPSTRGGSTLNSGGENRSGSRPAGLPANYNVPIRTPAPSDPSQAMRERNSRLTQPQRVPRTETNRPMPQPRNEQKVPAPSVPQASEAPSAVPPSRIERQAPEPGVPRVREAPPAGSRPGTPPPPAAAIRGLGEGGEGRGRGNR